VSGRQAGDDRGVALIAVLSACSLLLALGLSLALTTTVEVGIAANQRDGVQMLHAADAALERAIADLAPADWNAVLAGGVRSAFQNRSVSVLNETAIVVLQQVVDVIAVVRMWGE